MFDIEDPMSVIQACPYVVYYDQLFSVGSFTGMRLT